MTEAKLSGRRVSEAAVRAIEQPEFTETWHPYAHKVVLNVLARAFLKEGLSIVRKEYSLSKDGSNMFGVWEIEGLEDKEVRLAAGFRNSISKQLSWAIGVGERVFVCDNLVFKAQFIEFRKHTAGLSEKIMVQMAQKAIHQIVTIQFTELKAWHTSLKEYSLTEERYSVLVVKALKQGLIRPSKFYKFVELYESERYSASLHGLHGAMTELIRDDRLFQNERRNRQIAGFIDEAQAESSTRS